MVCPKSTTGNLEAMTKQTHINQPFVLTVISGKGGVGKSMTCINMAAMLTKLGYKVALLDADIGLANCATLLNEPVAATISQWMDGQCSLEDLPHQASGITLVTGANSPEENKFEAEVFMDALDQVTMFLKGGHDFIIIDTPAGAGEMSLWALDAAQLGILVLVDEPAAISDVYRLCKYVYTIDPEYNFAGIVNFAENEASAGDTFHRFSSILNYFLNKKIPYLGFIPASNYIREAIQEQRCIIENEADASVIDELKYIAHNVLAYANANEQTLSKSVY